MNRGQRPRPFHNLTERQLIGQDHTPCNASFQERQGWIKISFADRQASFTLGESPGGRLALEEVPGARYELPGKSRGADKAARIDWQVMTNRILTPSNQITLLRLLFVPVFAILVLDQHYRAALGVLTVAALSDILDGTVARLLKQESPLGVAMDPIADKILMTTGYITLALRGALPWWLAIIVLSRDVAIITTALVISLVAGYRPFHPSLLGKASTGAQVAAIFAAVCRQANVPYFKAGVLTFFIYLAAGLTLASAIHYVFALRQKYGRRESEDQTTSPQDPSPLGGAHG